MDIFGKAYRFLISRQFAVWSLVLLAVLLLVSGTLPNFSTLTQREFAELRQSRPILYWISSNFQVHQLMRSPLFLILPGAIWLSTALCMIRRLRREIPRGAPSPRTYSADFADKAKIEISQPLTSIQSKIQDILNSDRWQTYEVSENGAIQYFAQKGAAGFWGSVVFHLSMLVFLIGIVVSVLGRSDSEMVLTEGQTLAFTEDQMIRVNRKGSLSPNLPGIPVSLQKFESKFEQGKYAVDYAAHVKLVDGPLNAREGTVRVNKPLKHGRWQIFLHRYGFAPKLEIWDKLGGSIFDGFINLVVLRPEQVDHFDVPHAGLRIETRFFSDYEKKGEEAVSRSPMPNNPVMRIRALVDGEPVGEQDVPLGETVRIGDYRIRFADLRYWAWFGVVYDPGYGLIIIAFVLCVAGLAQRFIFSEKWLHVNVEGGPDGATVSLTGRSRYFPALFEREIDGIRDRLTPEKAAADVKGAIEP